MTPALLAGLAGFAALGFAAAPVAPEAAVDPKPGEGAEAQAAPVPRPRDVSYYRDGFEQTVRPLTRACDLPTLIRRLSGNPREAANVDASDQVRLPSTWWQPRVGFRVVTADDMLRGPGPGTGPAPGKWRVAKAKTRGVSAGFQIKDAQGTRFAIKFDVPKYPELTTGAEVVATYLYWASWPRRRAIPTAATARWRAGSCAASRSASSSTAGGARTIPRT